MSLTSMASKTAVKFFENSLKSLHFFFLKYTSLGGFKLIQIFLSDMCGVVANSSSQVLSPLESILRVPLHSAQ